MEEPVGTADVGTVIVDGGVGYVAARMLLLSSTRRSEGKMMAGLTPCSHLTFASSIPPEVVTIWTEFAVPYSGVLRNQSFGLLLKLAIRLLLAALVVPTVKYESLAPSSDSNRSYCSVNPTSYPPKTNALHGKPFDPLAIGFPDSYFTYGIFT